MYMYVDTSQKKNYVFLYVTKQCRCIRACHTTMYMHPYMSRNYAYVFVYVTKQCLCIPRCHEVRCKMCLYMSRNNVHVLRDTKHEITYTYFYMSQNRIFLSYISIICFYMSRNNVHVLRATKQRVSSVNAYECVWMSMNAYECTMYTYYAPRSNVYHRSSVGYMSQDNIYLFPYLTEQGMCICIRHKTMSMHS